MTEVRSWINKGTNTPPDWVVMHRVDKPSPNGSFLIRTKAGLDNVQARVLVGHMVIERKGVAYTRHPSEARPFLTELEEKDSGAYGQLPKVGGGASTQADIADRSDDTDDITARIQMSRPGPPLRGKAGPRTRRSETKEISPQPQKSAANPPATTERKSASASKFPTPIGRPPSIENRVPGELEIDDTYQRSIDTGPSRALIDRIARGWDWRMCLPLVVSNRSGVLYVIDGQHRLAAAKLRGDIPFLPCCVAVFDSVADEAALFVAMNRARRAINRLDDFHAAQAGGDADAQAIAALIESVGFTVSRKTGSGAWAPGEVAFTSAIAKVRRRYGEEMARDALQMMADAFPAERLVAGSSVFTAICAVLTAPPEGFDRERLFKALLTFDMKGWASFLDNSRGGTDRAKHLREMLLAAYDDANKIEEKVT